MVKRTLQLQPHPFKYLPGEAPCGAIWAGQSELVLILVESRGHGLEALALADVQEDGISLVALSQRILHSTPGPYQPQNKYVSLRVKVHIPCNKMHNDEASLASGFAISYCKCHLSCQL